METLSVADVAEMYHCTTQSVRDKIRAGKLEAVQGTNKNNRPAMFVLVSSLPANLQECYYKRLKEPLPAKEPKEPQPLDHFTAEEREEIDFWLNTVERWQAMRNADGVKSKAEVDNKFVLFMELEHPGLQISAQILYRKWAAQRDGDLAGLLDKRGKWRRGHSEVPRELREAF